MTQVTFDTQVKIINRPDAFVLLKELLRNGEHTSAPMFLNACMRVGRQLKLPFTEGVILASYTIWLERNPDGNLSAFLGAEDYSLVFGSFTSRAHVFGRLQ